MKGTIKQAYETVTRGKYRITDFVLATENGDVKCSKFGEWDTALLGAEVSFDARENEYKGTKKYTVQGEMKVEAPSDPSVKAQPQQKVDRESLRIQAEEAVTKNLISAQRIIKDLELGKVDAVALADMVGRTITAMSIEAQRGR